MNYFSRIIVLLCCLLPVSLLAQTHLWDNNPIPLSLGVGKEKRLEFPVGVANIKVKQSVGDASRIMTVPGDPRVYWLANEPFETSRVIVSTVDGDHYYLDVSASKDGGNSDALIITQAKPDTTQTPAGVHYDYVDLARYAAQHFHGPERLIKPLWGMSRAVLPYRSIPGLMRGNQFEARTLIQWRSQHPALFLTAVELKNHTGQPVDVLPMAVRGRFLFAAPHNSQVAPNGQLGDTTLIYLISERSFEQSIDVAPAPVVSSADDAVCEPDLDPLCDQATGR